MENPWTNAWADSTKSLPEPSPTWAAPSVSALHADHEDDLSTPSWPKEPVSEWGPTDLPADVWTTTDTAAVWNPLPSSFDKIALGKDLDTNTPKLLSMDLKDKEEHFPSVQPAPSSEPGPARLEVEPFSTSPVPASRISIPPPVEREVGWTTTKSRTSSPAHTPPNISIPPSEGPDGFGSFETGEDTLDEDSWTPTKLTFPSVPSAEVSSWGSAWQQPASADSGLTDEREDAWELARREKEVQDRHVPPELLASILQQLEILSKDLWTDDIPTTETGDELDTNFELNHSSLLSRLAPEDLVLPLKAPFQNTFTSKQLLEGLKLTWNFPSTRLSPMAMYMASKGSTSWEASVKARPTVAPDDITPPGWRIVGTNKEAESPAEDEKKKSGGLFSFFGRRTATSSTTPNRTASPAITTGETSITNQISRSSSENAQTVAQAASLSGSPVPIKTPSETATISKSDAQPSSFASSSVDGSIDESQHEIPTQSMVSRFLGRISSRSTKPQSRDSLALTLDDLEFLADVPTASSNADASGGILDMNSLNAIVNPTLPETLPLPLPPPPSRKGTPLLPQPTISGNNDLLSLLDGSDSKPVPSLRPSSVNHKKHTTSLSLTSIPIHPPLENSIWSDVAKSPIANGMSGKAQSQLGALPPPPVAIRPMIASAIDTTDSKKATSIQLPSSLKPSTGSMSQSSTRLLPVFNVQPAEQLSAPSNQADEEDEFSDFLSSPPIQNSPFNSFPRDLASFPVANSTTPSVPTINTSNDDFGDFGDAFSSLNPPPLPVKTTGSSVLASSNRKNGSLPLISVQPDPSRSRKSLRKADHSRTLSLLEAASARGRWLSPPSPIPEALSPPPDSSITKSSSNGHLDGRSEGMQAQQSRIMASLATSSSSPAILFKNAGDKTQHWQPAPLSMNLLVPSATLAPVPARPQPFFLEQNGTTSDNTKRVGGLSAQDLSFFEGL